MKRQYRIRIITTLLLAILFSGNIFSQVDTVNKTIDTTRLLFVKRYNQFMEQENRDSAIFFAMALHVTIIKDGRENTELNANSLYTLGDTYRAAGEYDSASYYLKQSAAIYNQLVPHIKFWLLYGMSLSRLGFICVDKGAKEEAKGYFLKALAIKDKAQNPDYVQMMFFLANENMSKGEYTKAQSIYLSLDKFLNNRAEKAFDHYLHGALFNYMAILYNQTGNTRNSLHYLQKAADMENLSKKEGYWGADNDYQKVMLNLAEIYAVTGYIDSAIIKCRKAEDSTLIPNADIFKVKAVICQQQKKYSEAIDLYKEYKKFSDNLPAKPAEYEAILVNLAIAYTNTKQFNKADALLRKQIAGLNQSGLGYSYVMQRSMAALCANLIEMERYTEATDSLIALCSLTFKVMQKNFGGMSESEKLLYENDINSIFDLIYRAAVKNKNISRQRLALIYQLQLQRKGMILNSQVNVLNIIKSSKDTISINAYNEWLSNKQMLAKQYSLPYNQRILNADSLERITELLEKKITALGFTPDPGNNPQQLPKRNLRQAASADIEFIRFDYNAGAINKDSAFYIAFILRASDSVPALVNLCSEKDLLRLMKDDKGAWINEGQLTQSIYADKDLPSKAFYNLVWHPLEQYLDGIKTINYSTSGLLNNIAFHAIYDGKAYLADRFDFRRFFSLADEDKKEQASTLPAAISIWGNINYDKASYTSKRTDDEINGEFYLIPDGIKTTAADSKSIIGKAIPALHTNELGMVKKIFTSGHVNVSSYENRIASEDNFKSNAAAMGGVLHISTHGFYTPLDKKQSNALLPSKFIAGIDNPLFRCGLAFAGVNYYWLKGVAKSNHDDGILTGFEIAQLDLHNVQLVTLSACETGLGDITVSEANLGLQRAFRLAGVRNMLVTLWQVPARQTATLLSLFYQNWLHGQSLSRALQSAQLTMKKEYPPYFWAGFVLIE